MDELESRRAEWRSSGLEEAWGWPQDMGLFSLEPTFPKPHTNKVPNDRTGTGRSGVEWASRPLWGFRGFL